MVTLLPHPFKKSIFDCDLTKFPAIVYLALIFLISRIPFINLGFSAFTNSTDQDVLAVVNSAYLLRYLDTYTVSRFPGYPVYEIINSLFIGGGWIATNTATMIVSFICVILFVKILDNFKIQNKTILVLTFAFIPIIWINSTITMDYMWSLMFILLGCLLVFTQKYLMAGIIMGLAVGTRFTSGFMLIPILYWFFTNNLNKKDLVGFLTGGIGMAFISFLPVFHKYNLDFFQGSGFIQTTPVRNSITMLFMSLSTSFTNATLEIFGILAVVAFIFLVIISFKNNSFNKSEHIHLLNFCWLIIIVFTLLYFVFPYKIEYLIPVVPWGLILLNEKLKRNYTIIMCVLLLLNGIISIDIQTTETTDLHIGISEGLVLKNYEERNSSVVQSKEYLDSLNVLFDINHDG